MDQQIYRLTTSLGQALLMRGWKLAIAESCTGGGICQALTEVPGSSQWFDCGFVTYSNESKIAMLQVRPQTLTEFGAVSAQTAAEMAQGALRNSRSYITAAVTGIAGPSGGAEDKPVGTVFFALASETGKQLNFKETFSGNREQIRAQTIIKILQSASRFIVNAL